MTPGFENGATVLVMAPGGNRLGRVVSDVQMVPGLGLAHEVAMEHGHIAYCARAIMFDVTWRSPKRCHISALAGRC
ncbi:hypothetical protein [Hypericibacter sp.]|uniref:hypothetical protein n=1 Tax=Hypericibacter sp. TaxID=2705401 RepID=UPI003D6D1B31